MPPPFRVSRRDRFRFLDRRRKAGRKAISACQPPHRPHGSMQLPLSLPNITNNNHLSMSLSVVWVQPFGSIPPPESASNRSRKSHRIVSASAAPVGVYAAARVAGEKPGQDLSQHRAAPSAVGIESAALIRAEEQRAQKSEHLSLRHWGPSSFPRRRREAAKPASASYASTVRVDAETLVAGDELQNESKEHPCLRGIDRSKSVAALNN